MLPMGKYLYINFAEIQREQKNIPPKFSTFKQVGTKLEIGCFFNTRCQLGQCNGKCMITGEYCLPSSQEDIYGHTKL